MNENIDTTNSNKIIINTDDSDIFYFSSTDIVPNNIKEDFKTKQNFLLVFVNPKSGSQQGKIVLEHAEKYKEEKIPEYKIISFPILGEKLRSRKSKELESMNSSNESVEKGDSQDSTFNLHLAKFDALVEFSTIIFNIIDKDDMTRGKKFIKKYLSDFPDYKIKILIAGGDGTVLGIVEDLNKEGIELNRCIFGAMPFGTGNDLSHSLGFGNECKVGGIRSFHRVLYTYLIGTPTKIDIWELSVMVNQNIGTIFDVVKNGEKIKEDQTHNKVLQFQKSFINYFSLGFDARVGFQFEQRRSSSRFCNKFIYAVEAAKRIFCCKKNYGLTQLLDSFQEGEVGDTIDAHIKVNNISEKEELKAFEDVRNDPLIPKEDNENLLDKSQRKLIFKTKNAEDSDSDIVLKGNPVNIICQNIDFYMGGTQNIWDKSSHIGITQEDATKNQYKEYRKGVLESFQKQAFDDKKIEFFTYEHGIELGLERVARGMAKRVYQGAGPVFLEFKKNPDNTEKIALSKVYLNCDGEFYHLQNPTQISVKLNTNICDGQINILKNEIGF
jgi:diacylglycerol kinase (ATP)